MRQLILRFSGSGNLQLLFICLVRYVEMHNFYTGYHWQPLIFQTLSAGFDLDILLFADFPHTVSPNTSAILRRRRGTSQAGLGVAVCAAEELDAGAVAVEMICGKSPTDGRRIPCAQWKCELATICNGWLQMVFYSDSGLC